MNLPIAFLAGLFVVLGNCELADTLPGEGVLDDLVWTACLLVAPWTLATLARSAATRSGVSKVSSTALPRAQTSMCRRRR